MACSKSLFSPQLLRQMISGGFAPSFRLPISVVFEYQVRPLAAALGMALRPPLRFNTAAAALAASVHLVALPLLKAGLAANKAVCALTALAMRPVNSPLKVTPKARLYCSSVTLPYLAGQCDRRDFPGFFRKRATPEGANARAVSAGPANSAGGEPSGKAALNKEKLP